MYQIWHFGMKYIICCAPWQHRFLEKSTVDSCCLMLSRKIAFIMIHCAYEWPTSDLTHHNGPQLTNLSLEQLKNSYASPKQTMDIICTAIVPSIADSFPVTPCSLSVLNQWDTQISAAIKSKYKLWMCTSTALIREDELHHGLGCSSLRIEYHYKNALALITSLNNKANHGRLTKSLLEQTQQLNLVKV